MKIHEFPRLHSTRSWPMANGQVTRPRTAGEKAVQAVQWKDFTLKQLTYAVYIWSLRVSWLFMKHLHIWIWTCYSELWNIVTFIFPIFLLVFWYVFVCMFHDYLSCQFVLSHQNQSSGQAKRRFVIHHHYMILTSPWGKFRKHPSSSSSR